MALFKNSMKEIAEKENKRRCRHQIFELEPAVEKG
jgi:hypothetical protein